MKIKLIILSQGNILASFDKDQDIVSGDWFYREGVGIKMCESVVVDILHTSTGTNPKVYCNKLMASDNPNHKLPRIDYGGLKERFGIVDTKIQEMLFVLNGEKIYPDYETNNNSAIALAAFFRGCKHGFEKSQSLDNKFSRQDIIDAIEFGTRIEAGVIPIDYKTYGRASNQFIESLKTPRMFYVDVEMQGDSVKISKLHESTK